ncbi:MAG: putrescine ABC transporter permease PotI, partial [Pseudomonadota bacterium]
MKRPWFLWLVAGFGFVFLYVPILSLVIFSFNESQLVTVWGGFSTKWYGELFRDEQVLGAAWVSLQVGVISATLAVVLGTLAAYVLVRIGRFWGRPVLRGMTTAPLVMPEVITGLSLLLLFVSMERALGWPAGRGMLTIVIAHTTFCLAYVAVVVQSRLVDMDDSL